MAEDDTEAPDRPRDIFRDVSGAVLWKSDALGVRFSYVSESASSLLGYSAEEWQEEQGFLRRRVHPEDWPALLQTLYRAAAEGGRHTCHHRMRRRDGSTFWAQTEVARSRTEVARRPQSDGVELAGLTFDVSDLKRSEEELRNAEFLSRMLVENLRDYGVFLLSPDGSVETWTSGAERLKGYEASEAVGKPLALFFPLEEVEKGTPARLLEDAAFDQQATYVGWMVKKGGAQFWARLTLTVIRTGTGEVRGFSNLATDLTENRRIEHELRESEEQFRRLVESQDYGVFMVSADGCIRTWNRGALRLLGYRRHEVEGCLLAQLFPTDALEPDLAGRLLVDAERLGNAYYEGWLVRKRGGQFWGLVTASAVESEDGELRGYSILVRDMTGARETEDALRESEQHFRLLVDSVKDYGVFMLSLDGIIESWNQGAQHLKGYRAHEAIGTNWSRFFAPEEVERGTPDHLLEQAATESGVTYEGWLIRKGGVRFWTHLTLNAVEDEDGRLLGLANVARDLTERKRAEDALREGEEQLRLLIDSLQDSGVFMTDSEGTITSWSAGAERLTGFRANEAVGASVSRLLPPAAAAEGTLGRLLERAAVGGRAEYEGWIVRANGSTLWTSVTVGAVRNGDGQLHGHSIVVRDLSTQLRAERTRSLLSDASNLLAGSLDQRTTLDRVARLATRNLARWCVVVMRVDGQLRPVAVAHVDPDRERALRAAAQGIAEDARTPSGVASVVQTEQPELREVVSDPAWLARAVGIEDVEVVRDLGVQSYLCVPLTARGKTFGAIALVAPPGRRFVREDLLLATDLSRRAALAIDNARLYEEAQSAVRLREEVLAIVSHDLRNPLNSIGLWASRIRRVIPEDAPQALAEFADRVHRTSRQMTRMISDLVDFSSIETGLLGIHPEPHPADRLVADALELLKPLADEKGVRLDTDTAAASGLEVCVDRERLLQVLSNVVGNAIKFTEADGEVRLRIHQDDGALVFDVCDTGPGIPQEDLPHIFDRYWRKDRHVRGSLGLGLAIARAIVESHGGEIWAENLAAGGARFSFSLPVDG